MQPIYIHPGSLMYQKRAPGIMYDELVLTTKTYARGVSGIELAWLRSKVSNGFGYVRRAETVDGEAGLAAKDESDRDLRAVADPVLLMCLCCRRRRCLMLRRRRGRR